MDVTGAVLLAVALCAGVVSVCQCGGTLENPVTDGWLCDHLVPPGMEGKEPDPKFNLYITTNRWIDYYIVSLVVGMGDYNFIGAILQGRADDKPCGVFYKNQNEKGLVLDCPPYKKNVFYTVNLTWPRINTFAYWIPPPDCEDKNLTMLTTIIKNNETYYTYVDLISPKLNTVQNTTLSTSTTLANISSDVDDTTTGYESTTQQEEVITSQPRIITPFLSTAQTTPKKTTYNVTLN